MLKSGNRNGSRRAVPKSALRPRAAPKKPRFRQKPAARQLLRKKQLKESGGFFIGEGSLVQTKLNGWVSTSWTYHVQEHAKKLAT